VVTPVPVLPVAEFERQTGWKLKPEGACRGNLCVPMPAPAGDAVDLRLVAERLDMPLLHDEEAGLWALGPAAGPVLTDAAAPDFTLPDWRGDEFRLGSLRGSKVLILAWAPW
jgi:hypothetical protein